MLNKSALLCFALLCFALRQAEDASGKESKEEEEEEEEEVVENKPSLLEEEEEEDEKKDKEAQEAEVSCHANAQLGRVGMQMSSSASSSFPPFNQSAGDNDQAPDDLRLEGQRRRHGT